MGQSSSAHGAEASDTPFAAKKIYIDAKALAFQLQPGATEILEFHLSNLYSSKLRRYNLDSLHTIEIHCKILSGKLEEAFISRSKYVSDLQQVKVNIDKEYVVSFTPASTNNWLPALYHLHLKNQGGETTKVVIVARIVQTAAVGGGGGGGDGEAEARVQRVRSLTTLPDESNPSAAATEQKSNDLSSSVTVHGDSSADIGESKSATEPNLELTDVVRKVTLYKSYPILRIDDKSYALQIDANHRKYIAFQLTSSYSDKLKQYNAEAALHNHNSSHYIAITIKVLAGSIAESIAYKTGPNGQFSSITDLSTNGEYIIKLTSHITNHFEVDTYYFKVVASHFGCKIVVHAHIQVEEEDENGVKTERVRALTVLPSGKTESEKRLEQKRGSANTRAIELEQKAAASEERYQAEQQQQQQQRQTYTSGKVESAAVGHGDVDVGVEHSSNGTETVLDESHIASDEA